MCTVKWTIKTLDRIAMVEDIVKEFSHFVMNIDAMKVTPNRVQIKCTCGNQQQIGKLFKKLKKLNDIIDINVYQESSCSPLLLHLPFNDYFSDIIHVSATMQKLIETAKKIAYSKYTVLLRGETGTGKELFARAIHQASGRSNFPFCPINCSSIPEDLVESELFGYEAGAFSGADRKGKAGLFETAHNGTLFLDEFGELPYAIQGKLLRVLQDNVIRRVGGTQLIPVDVRIIAATNANLEDMVESKLLRADLYYRINVIPLIIPPLRERSEDIPALLNFFIKKYQDECDKKVILHKESYSILMKYNWPGNIRELQNFIMRTLLFADDYIIDLTPAKLEPMTNISPCEERKLKIQIQYNEKEVIKKLLGQFGSARHVARETGLSHTTILNKIKRYKLEHLLKFTQRKK